MRDKGPNRVSEGSDFASIVAQQHVRGGSENPVQTLTAHLLAVSSLGEPYGARAGTFY